jgi:hypothetical protein
LALARENVVENRDFWKAIEERTCFSPIERYGIAREGRGSVVMMMEEQVTDDTEVGGRSLSWP